MIFFIDERTGQNNPVKAKARPSSSCTSSNGEVLPPQAQRETEIFIIENISLAEIKIPALFKGHACAIYNPDYLKYCC